MVGLMLADAYYAWAQREINPMHRDAGMLAIWRVEVADKLKKF